MAKIVHQRQKCIGCHACVAMAPQSWVIDGEDGKSSLVGGCPKRGLFVGEILACDLEDNRRAAEACPVNIIKIEEN